MVSRSRWYLSCFRGEDVRVRDSCSGHGVQSSVRGSTRRTSLRGSRYNDGTISDGGESLLHGSTRVMFSDGGPDGRARDSCSGHGVQSSVRGSTRRTSLRGSRYNDGTISDGRESLLHGFTRVMISDGGPDPSAKAARGKAIIMEDDGVNVKPTSQTRARPPFVFTVEEKIDVALDKYGEIHSFDLHGSLSLMILNEEDGCVGVEVLLLS